MLILVAVLYGYCEQKIKKESTGNKWIFGQFSTYHLVMLVILGLITWPDYSLIPLMILIQDISYHIFKRTWVHPGSWVNWKMKGFYLFKVWIPNTYIILFSIFIGLR